MLRQDSPNHGYVTATLELHGEETQALRDILDRYLRDLSYEISDTDRSAYKAEIKAHRELVRKIADKLP